MHFSFVCRFKDVSDLGPEDGLTVWLFPAQFGPGLWRNIKSIFKHAHSRSRIQRPHRTSLAQQGTSLNTHRNAVLNTQMILN